jgi:hypothetical protein
LPQAALASLSESRTPRDKTEFRFRNPLAVAPSTLIKHATRSRRETLEADSEWFLGTLKALNPDGYFLIDDFLDHVADIVEGDESSLDEAVDKLAVTQKRLHEAIDAANVSIGLQI